MAIKVGAFTHAMFAKGRTLCALDYSSRQRPSGGRIDCPACLRIIHAQDAVGERVVSTGGQR